MKYLSQTNLISGVSILACEKKHSDTNATHQKFKLFMRFFGPLGNFAALIQLIKIYYEGQVQGISIIAVISTLFIVATWAAYGLVIKDKPVFISNTLGFFIHITMLIGIIIF